MCVISLTISFYALTPVLVPCLPALPEENQVVRFADVVEAYFEQALYVLLCIGDSDGEVVGCSDVK